jgi:hypothetical protein
MCTLRSYSEERARGEQRRKKRMEGRKKGKKGGREEGRKEDDTLFRAGGMA